MVSPPDCGRSMTRQFTLALALAAAVLVGCRAATNAVEASVPRPSGPTLDRLPTGARLDPAGTSYDVGSMPLAAVLAPGGRRIALLLGGWSEQGVQIVDRASGRVAQTLLQPAAFLGLAFSPDGRTLYASGGNDDVVYRYAWRGDSAVRIDSLVLAQRVGASGSRYPAGLAPSADGRWLYVAENLADSLAVIDLATGRVAGRFATGPYPYDVAVAPDGSVYVSAWGGRTVSVFAPNAHGGLVPRAPITVGRHPSALLLDRAGARLFVASGSTDRVSVVDTRAGRVVDERRDPPPSGPGEGSTPNALALSADGDRLYVAEADANAVAVFDVSTPRAAIDSTRDLRLLGRVPVGWYPSALAAAGDTLFVINGKGRGTGPNVDGPSPLRHDGGTPRSYTLGQTSGTLTRLALEPRATRAENAALSARVARANGWDQAARPAPVYPPFEHVIYVIKENRTYDQVLGDLPQGDGDTSLVFFPRAVSPNHHALAERFGLYDRFFVNAEVSPDGHNWSTAAYATDYLEKTLPSEYSKRGRSYDYEGTNRGAITAANVPVDDVSEPASGYLWNLAERAGITFRNYGEFVVRDTGGAPGGDARYVGSKPFLAAHTNARYPGFDLNVTDQHRMDVWLDDFATDVARGTLPQLEVVRLPNDHTSGAVAGKPTPRAYMADNDLALGRMVEALSRSPYWTNTVVFVLEDDAQNGPDHVDSHRSVLLVLSAYSGATVQHRFVNTTDVIATMADILHLGALSQFDYYGRPLREAFGRAADLRPYAVVRPSIPLGERTEASAPGAPESARLALDVEDAADEDAFNRILWRAVKGERIPYPGRSRMSARELRLGSPK